MCLHHKLSGQTRDGHVNSNYRTFERYPNYPRLVGKINYLESSLLLGGRVCLQARSNRILINYTHYYTSFE